MNKNLLCFLGLHKYVTVETQKADGVIDFMSGANINRDVQKCRLCGKITYSCYILGINPKDKTLHWGSIHKK